MRVIAPEAEEEIAALAEMGRISYEARACAPEDVDGADFVIAATSDEGLNRAISRRCKSLRIPVNVVDVQEECSFIFPALVKDGDIVLMHELYTASGDAAVRIIPTLTEQGFQLVTVSELIRFRGGVKNGGVYYSFRPR